MSGADLFPADQRETFIVSAGRGKQRLYFAGDAYTVYRDRAKRYPSRDEAEQGAAHARKWFFRPGIKIEVG